MTSKLPFADSVCAQVLHIPAVQAAAAVLRPPLAKHVSDKAGWAWAVGGWVNTLHVLHLCTACAFVCCAACPIT